MVKSPPADEGDRFSPWSGKMLHATEQLSPRATTTKACMPEAHAPQQEEPVPCN